MRCEVQTITPAMAQQLLASNSGNRRLKKSHVSFFEEQIKRGQMQLTHQGIAISESGRLLDGQHRLTAIVNTGIEVPLMVASGLPDSSFMVLDTGVARTAGDVLSIEGAANCSTLAAGIRLYIFYKSMPGTVWVGGVSQRLGTTTAVKAEFDSDKDNWEWAARVGQGNSLAGIVSPASMAALLYMAHKSGFARQYLEDFVYKLRTGTDLPKHHPILAYRNRIINGTQVKRTNGGQARFADYIKLFNAYTTGQQVKVFKVQQFPPMPTLAGAYESIHDDARGVA